MIAKLPLCQESNRSTVEPDFLEMLPTIRRVAAYAFRHLRDAEREDLVAETVADAFAAFRRLVEQGKAAMAFPTPLAWFGIRRVREGRRFGSKLNVLDVMSPYAQHRTRFSVLPLPGATECNEWEEQVVEDRHASPAEIASFRIDFTAWLKQLQRSKRQVALRLVRGYATNEVAKHFRLSPARVSQLRQELRADWDEFQAVPEAA